MKHEYDIYNISKSIFTRQVALDAAQANPGSRVAIVTPSGTFTVVYTPHAQTSDSKMEESQ